MRRAAVIGIGNLFRHDDGVGLVAAEFLEPVRLDADVLLETGEPTRLIDAWEGRSLTVVIDAIRAGSDPGTVHRVEAGVDGFPDGGHYTSTHGAGLEAAFHLACALGRAPDRLIVYGIEPADVSEGRGLTPTVSAALPGLIDRVAQEVRALCV